MSRHLLLLALLSLTLCAAETRFDTAQAYSDETGGQALLVLQNGKIVHETYRDGGGKNTPQRIFSGTKAFWGLAVLEAEKRGLLDIDEKVAATLSEWRNDDNKASITLRQLMTFTSGLEALPGLHENDFTDRTAAALKARCVARPGKAFIYGPAALQVMHEVLRRKLTREKITPTRFLERQVLSQAGLGPQRYLPDARCVPLLAAGFLQTARQWAGMGRLLLQPPPALQRGDAANPAYAFGVWNNAAAGHSRVREPDIESMLDRDWRLYSWSRVCVCKAAPAELLACIGSHGQRLYVVPSQQLVIVRLGKGDAFRDAEFLRRVRWDVKKD